MHGTPPRRRPGAPSLVLQEAPGRQRRKELERWASAFRLLDSTRPAPQLGAELSAGSTAGLGPCLFSQLNMCLFGLVCLEKRTA